MSKKICLILFCFFLLGCEALLPGSVSGVSTLAPPKPQVTKLPPTLGSSLEDPSVSISVPTLTPTLTPKPTATPFFCQYLRGRTEYASFQSKAMGEEVRYIVHLPPCYDDYGDKAFPSLYLLHGWPMTELHWDILGVDDLLDDWISRGLVGPVIIIMPGVSAEGRYVHSSGGEWSFEGMVIQELLPMVDSTYRTWRAPEGRAIGGISRGGVWALEIGLRHLDRFQILGAHSPALSLNQPLPQHDPFFLAKEVDLSDARIYLDAGDADWARAATIRFRDLLLDQVVDVTYELHKGNHVDALWEGALTDYVEFYTLSWPDSYDRLPVWMDSPEDVWLRGE